MMTGGVVIVIKSVIYRSPFLCVKPKQMDHISSKINLFLKGSSNLLKILVG